MICKNCDHEVKKNVVQCVNCNADLHYDCAFQCVKCGKFLCDECAIKTKYQCNECYNVQHFSMEFISATMFESYIKCPHAFKHEFILNSIPKDQRKNKYSETGSLLHNLFDTYSQTRPLTPELLGTAGRELSRMFKNIDITLFDDADDLARHHLRCFETLANWWDEEQDKPIPLFTEMQHFVKLHDGLPLVRCTFDRINGERDDPANWEVEDYKTGKVYTSDMLQHNMQLPIYAMAIRNLYGALPKLLRLRFPQHTDRYGKVQTRVFEHIDGTEDTYVCAVKRGGTYSFNLSERLGQMIDVYTKIKRGDFAFNTDNEHFCNNFCPLGKIGTCDGLNTRWKALSQRGY